MDGHGTDGDINPLNPTFSEGQNNSTHGVQQDGGVMNPNNNNSLPMARCNSLDDMDGIDWSDNAVSFYIIAIVILRAGFELCNMSLGNNIC